MGTLTGIVGFIMTILVYLETKALKNVFKRKVRLPQIQKNLRTSASRINVFLNDWDNKRDVIIVEFSTCAALAESFAEKLSAKDKAKINDFLEKVTTKEFLRKKKIAITLENSDQAWRLYNHLSTLIARIDEIINDLKLD